MAHDVFISHSSKDKPVADAVCATLEARGIRCWIAPRDIESGESWPGAITRAIRESRVMVIVISTNSNVSEQVSREVTQAAAREVTIIPLRVEPVQLNDDLAYYLDRVHWLDAMTPPLERRLDELAEQVLRNLPDRPPKPVVAPPVDPVPAPQPPQPLGLRLIRPRGGESWPAGGHVDIVWETAFGDRHRPEAVSCWLTRGDARIPVFEAPAPTAPGRTSRAWTVPADLSPGDGYRVALSARGVDGVSAEAVSDRFAIREPAAPVAEVVVTRPTATTCVIAGSAAPISWHFPTTRRGPKPDSVEIELLSGESPLALLTPQDRRPKPEPGQWQWSVSPTLATGKRYRIAVRALAGDETVAEGRSAEFAVPANQGQVNTGRWVGVGIGIVAVALILGFSPPSRGGITELLSAAIAGMLFVGGPAAWACGLMVAFPPSRLMVIGGVVAGAIVGLLMRGTADQVSFTMWLGLAAGTGAASVAWGASKEPKTPKN